MADEKLPEDIEEALREARRAHCGCLNDEISDIESAIHRYAREREAAALERAVKVCDVLAEVMRKNHEATANDEWLGFRDCYETAAERIRALIHKEPANG